MSARLSGFVVLAALGCAVALGPTARSAAAQRLPAAIGPRAAAFAPVDAPRAQAAAAEGPSSGKVYGSAVLFGTLGSVAGTLTGYGAAWLLDRQFGTGQAPAFVGVIVGSVAGTALGTRLGVRVAGGRERTFWKHVEGAAIGLVAGALVSSAVNRNVGEGAAVAVFPLAQAAVSALLVARR